MTSPWPFEDAPNTASITTVNVLAGTHPILLVTHDSDDGSWQFLCGTTAEADDGRVVGLGAMVARDPSITQLADLPMGWRAWRETPATPWHRERDPFQE